MLAHGHAQDQAIHDFVSDDSDARQKKILFAKTRKKMLAFSPAGSIKLCISGRTIRMAVGTMDVKIVLPRLGPRRRADGHPLVDSKSELRGATPDCRGWRVIKSSWRSPIQRASTCRSIIKDLEITRQI